jgi:hypothetical protein
VPNRTLEPTRAADAICRAGDIRSGPRGSAWAFGMSDLTDKLRKALLGKDEIVITRDGKEVALLSPTPLRGPATTDGQAEPSCSFCGKVQADVSKLIAGPTAFICNECVGLCVRILREEGIDPEARK